MRGVEPVGLQAGRAEGLEDVGEQRDVELEVEVMVVSKGLAPGGLPHPLRVLVVGPLAGLIIEVVVEGLAPRECRFGEAGCVVDPAVRIHALAL